MFRMLVVAMFEGSRDLLNITVHSKKEFYQTIFNLVKTGAEYIEYFEY